MCITIDISGTTCDLEVLHRQNIELRTWGASRIGVNRGEDQ